MEIKIGDVVCCHSNHEPWEGAEVLDIQDGYATVALDGEIFEEALINLRSDSGSFVKNSWVS